MVHGIAAVRIVVVGRNVAVADQSDVADRSSVADRSVAVARREAARIDSEQSAVVVEIAAAAVDSNTASLGNG